MRCGQTLMDGPDAEQLKPGMPRRRARKMVGEWDCKQESQITGDERVLPRSQITMTAKLSIPQVRWNFLRSQAVEQLTEGELDDSSDYATLDFAELQEASRAAPWTCSQRRCSCGCRRTSGSSSRAEAVQAPSCACCCGKRR